MTNDTKITAMI